VIAQPKPSVEVTTATLKFARKQTLNNIAVQPTTTLRNQLAKETKHQQLEIMVKKLAQQHNLTLRAQEEVKSLKEENETLMKEVLKSTTEKQEANKKMEEMEQRIKMLELSNIGLKEKLDTSEMILFGGSPLENVFTKVDTIVHDMSLKLEEVYAAKKELKSEYFIEEQILKGNHHFAVKKLQKEIDLNREESTRLEQQVIKLEEELGALKSENQHLKLQQMPGGADPPTEEEIKITEQSEISQILAMVVIAKRERETSQ